MSVKLINKSVVRIVLVCGFETWRARWPFGDSLGLHNSQQLTLRKPSSPSFQLGLQTANMYGQSELASISILVQDG
jgi:hypothetical protein